MLWHIVNEERLVLTEYVLDEFRDVIARKFPAHVAAAEQLLVALEYDLLPVATSGVAIRDAKDQPILDAAIASAVDIIVTGDKDFHALGLTNRGSSRLGSILNSLTHDSDRPENPGRTPRRNPI